MIALMLAAPRSGSGKTTVTCALLRALQRRGFSPCSFKVGPDYIDPTFHRAVLGVESRNLDLFLSDADCVRGLFARGCAGHDAAVVEGVMGYYDGLGGVSDRASSWHVADTLGLPVVLVLPVRGASLTLAAELKGLCSLRAQSRIVGAILNECSPKLCQSIAPALERESGVPILGCLPPLESARIESRHLGLLTAGEIAGLHERLDTLAAALEAHVDLARLSGLCSVEAVPENGKIRREKHAEISMAVASDKAFNFTYLETLETLRAFGAKIVFFSPLEDRELPEHIGGLYLPGGYPELYAEELSVTVKMRESIASAVRGGMPTVAECGGFLYLCAALCDEAGRAHPMAGALPGRAENAGRLVRFGYETLCAESDSLLFRTGERIPAHEFHYWDASECGDALRVEKGEQSWRCGFVNETLYAGFPHLYFAGRPVLVERFVAAARDYGERHGIM